MCDMPVLGIKQISTSPYQIHDKNKGKQYIQSIKTVSLDFYCKRP